MSKEYPILGSPLQVNGVTLKNRMITTSMSPGHGYCKNNMPLARMGAYLEERAAGGTAMIIQTIVGWKRPSEEGLHPLPSCYDESCIPALRENMIEPVHRHGGLLCAQIYCVHDWKPESDEKESPYGPSDIAVLKAMGGFKAMTLEQIEEFKAQYFNAARICKEAGFDAIEIMSGVGGIMSRFMARATNNRTDEYGGSLENRCRLTREIIEGTRAVVGPDFPLVCRWSPIDFIQTPAGPGLSPDGQDMTEALQIVPILEKAGIDLHDLSIGWHETSEPLTTKVIPDGHWTYVSEKIKTVATKPVAQGYRNSDPTVMEQNLQAGKVDVIAGLRYSIADPELPRKVMEDRTSEMRKCIVCCRCIDDVVSSGKPLNFCGVNPHLGPELDHELYPPAQTKKKVMVVGAGPAGINAAVAACERGHEVSLYEQGPRICGCVKMSSIFSPYHERYLDYMKGLIARHPGIDLHLKTTVTPELVKSVNPDALIVAVGGDVLGLDVPGADGKNVIQSHNFLEMLNGHKPQAVGAFNNFMWWGATTVLKFHYTPEFARKATGSMNWPISRNVAIIGGGLPGCEFGLLCMNTGRTTAIIEQKKIGWDVGGSDRFGTTSAFKKAPNVSLYPFTKVTEITAEGVKAIQSDKTGTTQTEVFIPAKTVAITLGFKENKDLYNACKDLVNEIYIVGDANEPHRIADATKTGYVAGCAV